MKPLGDSDPEDAPDNVLPPPGSLENPRKLREDAGSGIAERMTGSVTPAGMGFHRVCVAGATGGVGR